MAAYADYDLRVDWSNEGDFDGSRMARLLAASSLERAEDVTSDLRFSPPLFVGRGRDQAREFAPPVAGIISFSLDNPDGKYSYANTSSPLYGNLLPGRLVQFKANYAGTVYPLFTGYLDVPTELPYRIKQEVLWQALDGLSKLKATEVSTAMYTSITTDVAIGHILDAAGWPTALRTLDTGKTTLARWWVDGVDAFTAIRDLVATEGPGALFYIDASGNLVFESRHYRLLTARSTTSQATFRSSGTEPVFDRDFQHEPGIRSVINICTVPVRSYTVAASAVIWTGPTPITFAPEETKAFTVSTTADGFTGALTPVDGVDYTLTAGAIYTVIPMLNRTSGKTLTLRMTATAAGATMTGLQVRAQPVTISQELVGHTLDMTDSQTKYGKRSFPSEFIPSWIPSVLDAQDYCNAIVGRYDEPVPQVRIKVSNANADRLEQALNRQVSDRITVVEAERAFINADFTIESVTHTVTSGRNHETRFSCERANEQSFWVLGDASWGILGTTTRLGY